MKDIKTVFGLLITVFVTLVLLTPMIPYCGIWYLSKMLHCVKVNVWLDKVGAAYGNKIVKPVLRFIDNVLPETVLLNI